MPRGKGWRRVRTNYPEGVIAILDNGGKTIDRYTVVYTPWTCEDYPVPGRSVLVFPNVAMSGAPFHPQGVGMHGETLHRRPTAGWGTGQRVIRFEDLPADCQQLVRNDLGEGKGRTNQRTHAPGPWKFEKMELHEGLSGEMHGHQVVAADGTVICDNQTYYPQAVTEDHARLIAALPDLLDVARVLLASWDCEDDEDAKYEQLVDEAVGKARAIIAEIEKEG